MSVSTLCGADMAACHPYAGEMVGTSSSALESHYALRERERERARWRIRVKLACTHIYSPPNARDTMGLCKFNGLPTPLHPG